MRHRHPVAPLPHIGQQRSSVWTSRNACDGRCIGIAGAGGVKRGRAHRVRRQKEPHGRIDRRSHRHRSRNMPQNTNPQAADINTDTRTGTERPHQRRSDATRRHLPELTARFEPGDAGDPDAGRHQHAAAACSVAGSWRRSTLPAAVLPARVSRKDAVDHGGGESASSSSSPSVDRRSAELLCQASSASAPPRSRCNVEVYAERNPAKPARRQGHRRQPDLCGDRSSDGKPRSGADKD